MAEDYTTYTEVDPNSRFTVTSSKIDVSGLSRNEEAYVYKDFGVDYFNGDFEHDVDVCLDSASGSSAFAVVWMLANLVEAPGPIGVDDQLRVQIFNGDEIRIWETAGGTEYWTSSYALSTDTVYYIKIKRDENVGTYGTIYLDIYTSANDRDTETSAVSNLSMALHITKNDFRYLYAISAFNDGNTDNWTGYVENLKLYTGASGTLSGTGSLFATASMRFDTTGSIVGTSSLIGTIGEWNPLKRIEFKSDHTKVDSDQTNFPSRLNLDNLGTGGIDWTSVFDEVGANSKKIAITTSDGITQCYVEIENWDGANKVAQLWFKAPFISSSSDTTFYLYYDSTHADNLAYVGDTGDTSAQQVWDDNFKAVYHMAQDPNGDPANAIKDSTSNINHGTPYGAMTSDDLVDGVIGKALDFEGTDDCISISDNTGLHLTDTTFEVLCKTSKSAAWGRLISKDNYQEGGTRQILAMNAYSLIADTASFGVMDDGVTSSSVNSTTITNDGNFHNIVGSRTAGSLLKMYVDGFLEASEQDDTSATIDVITPLTLAAVKQTAYSAEYFDGILDEVRISNIARSEAWLKATHYSNIDELFMVTEDVTLVILRRRIEGY